jgi:hypothetical protein
LGISQAHGRGLKAIIQRGAYAGGALLYVLLAAWAFYGDFGTHCRRQ